MTLSYTYLPKNYNIDAIDCFEQIINAPITTYPDYLHTYIHKYPS